MPVARRGDLARILKAGIATMFHDIHVAAVMLNCATGRLCEDRELQEAELNRTDCSKLHMSEPR
jgi:hypothetical protein